MSENRRDHIQALYTFDAVVHRVPAGAWDRVSPCEDWTARQVVSHLVFILPLWIGQPAPPGDETTLANGDPVQTWTIALAEHLVAIDDESMLATVVSTNMGPMPLDTSLGILLVDPLLHAWDLAKATGVEVTLPNHLCQRAYDTLDFARSSLGEMFQSETAGPSTTIEERALRISGRDPRWTIPF